MKFSCYGKVIGSKYLGEFEASTKEAAEELAVQQASVSLCHHCNSEIEDPEIVEIIVEESGQ
jgi:hypothetical protein